MSKRNIIIAAMTFLLITSGVAGFKFFFGGHRGFNIEIKNNTNESITGLAITYNGIFKDIELPQIDAGKTYKTNVNPSENFGENSMIIYYKDKRGYEQKNTLIGYFEKGYKGEVKVNINSRDENGLIIMKVQEDLF
jgi:hypothetical protein